MSGFVRTKDFDQLRDDLVRARSLFVDPEFPPDVKSLYYNGRIPSRIGRIVWKRPRDIVQNPRFIVQGARRSDLAQGSLGDCWFIAGAATLATGHRKQFLRVVPGDQDFDEKYAGIFHFNFWWYGKWVEVIIDDYLPTDGYNLIFGYNRERKDEFWSPLIEKAYAKLRGCYEALDGGKLQDSMVDFTGGISEVIDLKDKANIPGDLYDLLYKAFSMNSMMGGSIYQKQRSSPDQWETRRPNGLYEGHAYSITGFSRITSGGREYRLMRLRNPWGRAEWNGAWSDRSPEMTYLSEEIKNDIKFRRREDGEFWMEFEDFMPNFDEINMCHLQPDALTEEIAEDEAKQRWNVTVYHDAWIRGVTAGGCGNPPYDKEYWYNPQFFVTLRDVDDDQSRNSCTLIVSLMEKEKGNATNLAIEFNVYQLKYPDRKPLNGDRAARNALRLKAKGGSYVYYREVTRRMELPPGVYVIIPTTFEAFKEGEFLLRIFTEKAVDSGVLDEDESPTLPTRPGENTFTDVFLKHVGRDRKLDARELKAFLLDMSVIEFKEKTHFNTESCRSLLTMIDNNRSGMLDLDETRMLWKDVKTYRDIFIRFDKDRSGTVDTFELNSMFGALGFPVNRAVLTSIVRRYGGRDSKISLQDFVIVISKLILMYNIFLEQQKATRGKDGIATFTRNEFLQYTMYC
ncbi:calpain-9-like isoform X2 [Gigantopelta aegis]|uniref:calpain-9-like isoform X2 n=1 Tax=Gigantopelta aegis TaxID=1735272 RepID=UPI001B88E6A7|nr:calpain-9-like isoform X2 [Gigantopelta aegis]